MKKHLGSTIVLTLGVLSFLSHAGAGNMPASMTGLHMILGALAYRSAKKRKLGEVKSTWIRKILEGVALVLIVLSIVLHRDFIYTLENDPARSILVPPLILIAYLFAVFWKSGKQVEDTPSPDDQGEK